MLGTHRHLAVHHANALGPQGVYPRWRQPSASLMCSRCSRCSMSSRPWQGISFMQAPPIQLTSAAGSAPHLEHCLHRFGKLSYSFVG